MPQRLREQLAQLRRARRSIGALLVAFCIALATIAATPQSACACSTKRKAYAAAMKADLRNLVTAQENFFTDSLRYATSVQELVPTYFALSANIELVSFSGRPDGFNARVRAPSHSDRTCAIAVGPRADGSPEEWEGEPRCDPEPRELFPLLTGAAYAVLLLIAIGIRVARADSSLPPISGGTIFRFFALAVVHPYWPHDRWDLSCDSNAVALESAWLTLMAAIAVWMAFRGAGEWEPPRPA